MKPSEIKRYFLHLLRKRADAEHLLDEELGTKPYDITHPADWPDPLCTLNGKMILNIHVN